MNNEGILVQLGAMQQELMELRRIVAEQNERIIQFENQQLQGNLLPAREPRVADPEIFSGDRKKAKQFLLQLKNVFNVQPSQFTNDSSKLAYTVSFLCGPAFTWVAPYMEANHSIMRNVDEFAESFLLAFGDVDCAQEVERAILKIRQGN